MYGKKVKSIIKLSYCWFNRENLLKNTWENYHNKGGKKKAANCYAAIQEFLKEDARKKYNLVKEEKG